MSRDLTLIVLQTHTWRFTDASPCQYAAASPGAAVSRSICTLEYKTECQYSRVFGNGPKCPILAASPRYSTQPIAGAAKRELHPLFSRDHVFRACFFKVDLGQEAQVTSGSFVCVPRRSPVCHVLQLRTVRGLPSSFTRLTLSKAEPYTVLMLCWTGRRSM